MLQTITSDGYFSWACHNGECDFHDALLTAHVEHRTVRYALHGKASQEDHKAISDSLQSQRMLVDANPALDAFMTHKRKQANSGAVIALPQCLECGSQMFLKADYTLKEILKEDVLLPFIETDDNSIQGYVMKLSHARNFRLLNMLYGIGKMPEKPVLEVLPVEVIATSPLAQFGLDVADAFWLPFTLTGKAPPIPEIYSPLMSMRHLIQNKHVKWIS